MSVEFKRFATAQMETITREIGRECLGNLEQENAKVKEWIEKNAARFRAEWVRPHGAPEQGWSSRCDGAN